MTEPTLFDLVNPEMASDVAETFAPTSRRTMASTSLECYRDLQDTLPAREQAVMVGLRRYKAVHGRWPTSYELFRSMAAEGYAFDLNSVRPRLTELWKKSKVRQQARRVCGVTGKSAYTWAINQEE